MYIFHNTKLVTIVTLALTPFFIIGLVGLANPLVYGQAPYGVFGGRIGGIIQCTCNGGHVLIVGPPGIGTSNPLGPGRLRFAPGSILYEYGQIKKMGAWVLGTYAPPTPCLKWIWVGRSHFCIFIPHSGNIVIVGTSR